MCSAVSALSLDAGLFPISFASFPSGDVEGTARVDTARDRTTLRIRDDGEGRGACRRH